MNLQAIIFVYLNVQRLSLRRRAAALGTGGSPLPQEMFERSFVKRVPCPTVIRVHAFEKLEFGTALHPVPKQVRKFPS
jgi:hypothetical protein